MRKRQGNNPKRRVLPLSSFTGEMAASIAKNLVYVGSGHHKRYPLDYGLIVTNPRPTKSLCDLVRPILLPEAEKLLLAGVRCGMFSEPDAENMPKYIWAVTGTGEVFEAKTDINTPWQYHGYPLDNEEAMRLYILAEWRERNV